MENSRRNILIIVVSLIVACFCITAVGLGVFGYLFPFERVASIFSTEEPVVFEPVEATQIPTQIPAEPTAIPSLDLPTST